MMFGTKKAFVIRLLALGAPFLLSLVLGSLVEPAQAGPWIPGRFR